jgi:hypothetical protein
MVVLRKPGKSNYIILQAYRPIALLSMVGKIMEFVLAKRLSYLIKIYKLLLQIYVSRQKGKSIEHAFYFILNKIYKA